MSPADIYNLIRKKRIIAIVRGYSPAQILNIANALSQGGIELLEVTCNTPDVANIIETLTKETTGKMTIGAGTVINKDLCRKVIAAGAKYIIAPDVNPEVINHCTENNTAVLPGAATPTEVLTAARAGA